MSDGKKELKIRLGLVYVVLLLVWAIAIVGHIVKLQFVEGDFWRKKAEERTVVMREVTAQRGNIYSSDGKLLAITVPIFDIYLDLGKERIYNNKLKKTVKEYVIPDSIFNRQLNRLSDSLSMLFPQKSAKYFKQLMASARKKEQRYVLLQKNVSLEQMERMKSFPILKKERRKRKASADTTKVLARKYEPAFNRAVILDKKEKRVNPYGYLARRTVGIKVTEDGCDTCYNGIDGAYNKYLKGKQGERLERRMAQNVWVPIEDEDFRKAEDGLDILSTIDARIQQLAESSLRQCLDSNDADKGCVVLMEVGTGYIKAISSLTRLSSGEYLEVENIAVSDRYEPGSTFKTVTSMIMLENGICDTSTKVPTGEHKYGLAYVKDVKKKDYGMISLIRAFEVSSNVGMCAPIYEHYNKKRKDFYSSMVETFPFYPLDLDLNVKIAKPTIISDMAPDVNFMNLCYGYGVDMSVLQMLTFYNGIANGGKMIKPLFVSHLLKTGDTIKSFKPEVLKEKMCSKSTLDKLQDMMKGVVKNGSARRLSKTPYGIAGKTGTAASGYADKNGVLSYRASFVGYFPADNPKYSCMVLVINPKKNLQHGGELAAPVFKDIADRVCGTRLDIDIPIAERENRKWPKVPKASAEDLQCIFQTLDIPNNWKTKPNQWIIGNIDTLGKLTYDVFKPKANMVPSVIGMTVKDALYLLENMGLKVIYNGRGKVTQQSLEAGGSFKKGDAIYLTLGMN